MPLIGFTVFHDEVRDGTKRQTIRRHRHRKRPIKVGDKLYLYWHLGRKDCHLLRVERCTATFTKPWGAIRLSEEIAERDGFQSCAEMREWFRKNCYSPDDNEIFDVIRW
jgi:hypothetical protein